MSKTGLEKATFGAGCFWGVEDIFMKLKGVIETQVGYAGGDFDHPSYQDVCSDVYKRQVHGIIVLSLGLNPSYDFN